MPIQTTGKARSEGACPVFQSLTDLFSIGEAPFNINTLYGFLNLTYDMAGETSDTHDMTQASCRSVPETVLIAKVLFATA